MLESSQPTDSLSYHTLMSTSPEQVWFITGCSSGFGRELVVALLGRGHKVIATARQQDKITDLGSLGAALLSLDVTWSADLLEAALKEAVSIYGHIDVVVNNAGFFLEGTIEEVTCVARFWPFLLPTLLIRFYFFQKGTRKDWNSSTPTSLACSV
jgi:NAD(P)-dependent dehydrogenase (short-subunit alcohol dehydrogenase family)